MTQHTQATEALTKAGIPFTLHPYDYNADASGLALDAAHALGFPPQSVLKTLMIEVDGTPACCVIAADRKLDFKRTARAFGGKSARMMPIPRAEARTGYRVGGISPFGQRSPTRTAFEPSTLEFDSIVINAGSRGLLLAITPGDALRATNAITAPLSSTT
ncbi:aminoacyl-tRNA deacylase [Tanticharoenia sakaeratensis]|uniref:Cys-tRNA(Pro)/Cys-tRNA(Cys) deacylase n=1 Tax=Tanticharoenia sakaeratensis NBRC 103193 TaxID=1231623 RepID=A0A0D6MLV3_9PROT|nr:aminoacyl-tRNA deacylase [Tanticharoenia sakaeratensis]GAN54669.1 YbaK family protein [Tanticharoenia sakaeratensis NBRC 103193]GBQ16772.1 hypothetical protein AA103193_0100 [Tanticharoenia sakaeratensis NBRC 103193]